MKPLKDKYLVLLTTHGKEQVISPVMENLTGCLVQVNMIYLVDFINEIEIYGESLTIETNLDQRKVHGILNAIEFAKNWISRSFYGCRLPFEWCKRPHYRIRRAIMIQEYKVVKGPEGFLPPSAAQMGVRLPDQGMALIEGFAIDEDAAFICIAKKLLNAKNPVFFPGPLILWNWAEDVPEKAKLVVEIINLLNAKIIPMPDYRPKYPKINPEIEINPNHPNLTIWHNKIDVCVFIGIHCHYANVALKIIRGGTDCYTIALCAEAGHEDAMASISYVDSDKLKKLIEVIEHIKNDQVSL